MLEELHCERVLDDGVNSLDIVARDGARGDLVPQNPAIFLNEVGIAATELRDSSDRIVLEVNPAIICGLAEGSLGGFGFELVELRVGKQAG